MNGQEGWQVGGHRGQMGGHRGGRWMDIGVAGRWT